MTPDAARRLLVAAVEAFAERGYHATTTRDIAGRAGMSPAALYIHYKTKEELLHRISSIGHEKALRIMRRRGRGRGQRRRAARATPCGPSSAGTPEHHTTARVVQYELDALGPEHRAEIIALRRRTDAVAAADHPGRRGRRASSTCRDVPGTTLAVLSLCIDVARWFNRGRPAHARRGRRALRRPRAAHGGAPADRTPEGAGRQAPAAWIRL